jgi:predicted urease superfamily metal-dependent hydrolase
MTHRLDHPETPTAADLRALVARRQVRLFEIGYLVGLHPAKIGLLLNEHRPLPAELAQRLQAAIEAAATRRREAR